ncbi:response regulator [Lunatimonas salinarum]|uniref:response regulator n=1 Tax=Lunatimonas salinarum TaxID=1774590 RepID=UPI001ADFE9AB|nr:response regulator [Lunatimonas salinarum]
MNATRKVLCVDDEPINLLILKKILGTEYLVYTAENALLGLEILNQEPDLKFVITDMRMPGMDGLEFIGEASKRFKDKRFFMLSGFEIDEKIQAALDSGLISQYFMKPANFDEIHRALQER